MVPKSNVVYNITYNNVYDIAYDNFSDVVSNVIPMSFPTSEFSIGLAMLERLAQDPIKLNN